MCCNRILHHILVHSVNPFHFIINTTKNTTKSVDVEGRENGKLPAVILKELLFVRVRKLQTRPIPL